MDMNAGLAASNAGDGSVGKAGGVSGPLLGARLYEVGGWQTAFGVSGARLVAYGRPASDERAPRARAAHAAARESNARRSATSRTASTRCSA